MLSLLYVSESRLSLERRAPQIDQIVATSRERNARLGVSGALIATGSHFAQVLEGTSAALAQLMRSIRADSRHEDVEVVRCLTTSERFFSGWAMAYFGAIFHAAEHIRPLLEHRARGPMEMGAADRLLNVMQEYAC